jgi:drug/metabolite transporter (DMT)-like permease
MDPRPTSSKPWIWVSLLSLYLIWGSTYLAIRVALRTMPPFVLGGARFLIAGVLLFAWSLRKRDPKRSPLGWAQWRATGVIGALLLFGGNGAVIFALRYVTSSVIALLVSTTPFWVLVIGRMWHKEEILRRDWLGLLIGFAGVLLLLGPSATGTAIHPVGALLGLLASAAWALGSVYARRAPIPQQALVATSMEMLLGGGALMIAAAGTGELAAVRWSDVSTDSWTAFVYLIVFGSWMGFSAYAYLLKEASLPVVSSYAYVNPVVAMVLGALFLGEALTTRTLFAAALIVAAVAATVIRPPRKKTTVAAKHDLRSPSSPENASAQLEAASARST